MITFILGTILGVYLGWKYELAINDFIESIKEHLNIK
jgi:ABC-type lipoprotein release transport system permease subunit